MSKNQEERKDAGISATMLLSCPRQVILAQEHDYYEKPSAYHARFRGVLGHLMMEAYADGIEDVIQERRLSKSIDVDGVEVEITGKPDWVDTRRNLLIDFKSCASTNTKPINQGLPKESHTEQIAIYAWLLVGGVDVKTGEIVNIPIEKGGIHYFDMKTSRKVAVDLWSLEETEEFIRERLRPFVHYEQTKELPPILVGDKGGRSWKCNWCPLREACDAREAA